MLAGSQVNALDKQRQTPLHVATVEDKAAILEVLLQNGANPDLVDVNLNNGIDDILILLMILFKYHPIPPPSCTDWTGLGQRT